MEFLILGGIYFLDFVFSVLGYSLREISKFKINEFVDRLSEEHHGRAARYEKQGERIEAFLDARKKPQLPFILAGYLLDAVFIFVLLEIGSSLFLEKGTWGFVMFLLVYIGAVFLFCRQLALGLADERSEEIVFFNYWIIRVLDLLLFPVTRVVSFLDRFVYRVAVLGRPERNEEEDREEEIKESITEGFEDGVLEEDEKKMIESVLSFDDSDVREKITQRTDNIS